MEICSRWPLVFNKNLWLVSKFPLTDRSNITSYKNFSECRDDLLSWNREQHFSDSFFQEFHKLWHTIKFPPMVQRWSNENSEYVDIALACKNSYLSIGLVTDVENILYSRSVKDNSSNVQNSVMVEIIVIIFILPYLLFTLLIYFFQSLLIILVISGSLVIFYDVKSVSFVMIFRIKIIV